MKIESRVVLSREELEVINKAFEILCDYTAESIRVGDSQTGLKDKAQDAYNYIDNFLCEYSEIYEQVDFGLLIRPAKFQPARRLIFPHDTIISDFLQYVKW